MALDYFLNMLAHGAVLAQLFKHLFRLITVPQYMNE